jgi:hypothetical protein
LQPLASTRLTVHAQLMMERRHIALEWVEVTIRDPSYERTDERDKSLTLAFRQIDASGGKWLRVVYRREGQICVVVTAFFDRNQEKRT